MDDLQTVHGVGEAHAWRHPRTVRLGLVALAFARATGAGSNWISLAVTTATTPRHVGTLAYAAFLTAVTLGRRLGPLIVDRVGRPGALRAAACAACLGVTLFAAGPRPVDRLRRRTAVGSGRRPPRLPLSA